MSFKEIFSDFVLRASLVGALLFGGGVFCSQYAGLGTRDGGLDKRDFLGEDVGVDKEEVPVSFEENLGELEEKLRELRWVSYAPTNFDPVRGRYPDAESLEKDLLLLYQTGFRGVITYGSENSLEKVPRIAKALGFEGVVMGVWLPNALQMGNAESQREHVEGYCLGNENLKVGYSFEVLSQAMERLRKETNKPVSTTERYRDYFGEYAEELMGVGDWIFPNVHPYWAGIRDGEEAAEWTEERYKRLREEVPREKVLFFKEVGLPTGGDRGCNEEEQKTYYGLLKDSEILFSYFEAFDQPWKNWARVEPYWGIFRFDRGAKAVISIF